jgi:maleylacetate reductase
MTSTARGDALYGAWLCGACLGAVTMSLHHKLCHVLGGAFDLPHADTDAVVPPYAADCNRAAAPDAPARVARALGASSAPAALQALGRSLGLPGSLAELGLTEADVERAVALATVDPYATPAPVTGDGIRTLLLAALRGEDV